MVIPTFVRQALRGQPITVYGDGTQSRCFGYVGDVADALVKLMDHPGSVGEVFNIGSTEEVTIGELAEMIKVLTGSKSEIHKIPYDQAYEAGFEDMHRRIPDTTKIHDLVGFQANKDAGGDPSVRHSIRIGKAAVIRTVSQSRPHLCHRQGLTPLLLHHVTQQCLCSPSLQPASAFALACALTPFVPKPRAEV